jgi:hypothetical protein
VTGEPFEGTWREISRNKDIALDAANARIAELEKQLSLYSNLSAEYGLSMFHDISVAVTEAVAAEREACAKVCEELRHPFGLTAETEDWTGATDNCAAAIRARSENHEQPEQVDCCNIIYRHVGRDYQHLEPEDALSKWTDDIKRQERDEYRAGWQRYEKLRKLNPRQFGELWERHLKEDMRFDDMVDALLEAAGKRGGA